MTLALRSRRLLIGSRVSQLRRWSCLIGCSPDREVDDETGAHPTCLLKNTSSSGCGRRRSRSPTGCSAASPKPRTSSRRRCCASIRRSSTASGSPPFGPTSPPSPPDWRSTSCARRGRGVNGTSASGCRSRSSPTASTILPSMPRWPTRCRSRCWCCSRACLRSSEPRCSCTTCSITAIRRSRKSSARARTTCASSRAGPGVTSRSGGPGSRPRGSSVRSSRRGFSPPPSRGI